MFAKLYDTKAGQVLAKLDRGQTGPEVRFYFECKELGLCSSAYDFPDTAQGWDDGKKLFHDIYLLQAEAIALDKLKSIREVLGD